MSASFDYVLKRAQLFANGVGKAGTTDEFKPPKIEKISETKQSSGMIGQRNVYFGYKPFMLDVKLNSFDPEVMKLAGVSNGNEVPFSARGFLVGDGGKQHTGVFSWSGEVSELDTDKWVSGKWVAMMFKVSCSAIGLTMDGKEVYDIDIPNLIDSWGGTDNAAAMRSAIGFTS